jgi:hypothetical protein
MAFGRFQESGHVVIVLDAHSACWRTGMEMFFNRGFGAVLSNLPFSQSVSQHLFATLVSAPAKSAGMAWLVTVGESLLNVEIVLLG